MKSGVARFKKQDHCFRDIARMISEVRDAEVRLQTVRQLQEITRRTSQQTFRKTEELLLAELEHFMAAFADWQKQAAPQLEKLQEEIAGVAGRKPRLQKYSLRGATRLQSRASCPGLRKDQTDAGEFPRISQRSKTAALSTANFATDQSAGHRRLD